MSTVGRGIMTAFAITALSGWIDRAAVGQHAASDEADPKGRTGISTHFRDTAIPRRFFPASAPTAGGRAQDEKAARRRPRRSAARNNASGSPRPRSDETERNVKARARAGAPGPPDSRGGGFGSRHAPARAPLGQQASERPRPVALDLPGDNTQLPQEIVPAPSNDPMQFELELVGGADVLDRGQIIEIRRIPNENPPSWVVERRQEHAIGRPAKIGTFVLNNRALSFAWAKPFTPLRSCLLKITIGGNETVYALRKAVEIEDITVDYAAASRTIEIALPFEQSAAEKALLRMRVHPAGEAESAERPLKAGQAMVIWHEVSDNRPFRSRDEPLFRLENSVKLADSASPDTCRIVISSSVMRAAGDQKRKAQKRVPVSEDIVQRWKDDASEKAADAAARRDGSKQAMEELPNARNRAVPESPAEKAQRQKLERLVEENERKANFFTQEAQRCDELLGVMTDHSIDLDILLFYEIEGYEVILAKTKDKTVH